MPHHVRINPLLYQGLFCHILDKAVNDFWGEGSFLIGTMLPQCFEHRIMKISPIYIDLQIILNGKAGFSFQWDSSEFFALTNHINNSWVSVGLEIPNF